MQHRLHNMAELFGLDTLSLESDFVILKMKTGSATS